MPFPWGSLHEHFPTRPHCGLVDVPHEVQEQLLEAVVLLHWPVDMLEPMESAWLHILEVVLPVLLQVLQPPSLP